jgi:hypothetical protein
MAYQNKMQLPISAAATALPFFAQLSLHYFLATSTLFETVYNVKFCHQPLKPKFWLARD